MQRIQGSSPNIFELVNQAPTHSHCSIIAPHQLKGLEQHSGGKVRKYGDQIMQYGEEKKAAKWQQQHHEFELKTHEKNLKTAEKELSSSSDNPAEASNSREKIIENLTEIIADGIEIIKNLSEKKEKAKRKKKIAEEQHYQIVDQLKQLLDLHAQELPFLEKIGDHLKKAGDHLKEEVDHILDRLTGKTSDSSSSSSSSSAPKPESTQETNSSSSNLTSTVPIVIADAKHFSILPGKTVYKNNSAKYDIKKLEEAVQDAYNNSNAMANFLSIFFSLSSFDNKGTPLTSTVHYLKNYVNAFFNGSQMVYGDGNKYFDQFVRYPGIAAHEIWHGVTGERLAYQDEAGALNESYSDVMGACCEMWDQGIAVKDYHWAVGKDLITYKENKYPLRTFKEGPAYVNVSPLGGTDPQPDDYIGVDTSQYPDDNGGVHIYSKIPNRVFYMLCQHYQAWQKPALFWYDVLNNINNPNINFAEFATFQINKARKAGDEELAAVLEKAWDTVKVPYKSVEGYIPAISTTFSHSDEKEAIRVPLEIFN